MKTRNINQSVIFKASPHEVYETLMDSKKHSTFTGSKAIISRKVGGKFKVYDGGLHGKNLELIKDKKIVQAWQCDMKEWPKNHYSVVSFILKKIKDGAKLTLKQLNVPSDCYVSISNGWKEYYWKPMKKMFQKGL